MGSQKKRKKEKEPISTHLGRAWLLAPKPGNWTILKQFLPTVSLSQVPNAYKAKIWLRHLSKCGPCNSLLPVYKITTKIESAYVSHQYSRTRLMDLSPWAVYRQTEIFLNTSHMWPELHNDHTQQDHILFHDKLDILKKKQVAWEVWIYRPANLS